MRDPILANKFNRLQLFLRETPAVPVSPEVGFRNRDIKGLPARTPVVIFITVQINAVPARDRWQILPNVTIPFWFIRPTIAVLILNLIDCTRYIVFEEKFSKFMKQKLMLCISLDNFKTNQRFWIMKIKLFLETIFGQNNFMPVCY